VAVIQRENKKLNKNGISGGHLKFIWLGTEILPRFGRGEGDAVWCFRLGDAFTTQILKVMIFFYY